MFDIASEVLDGLWPHQVKAVQRTCDLIDQGEHRICITSPTGGGKTRMMVTMINALHEHFQRQSVYCTRRLLLDQLHGVLNKSFPDRLGVRASKVDPHLTRPMQLSMCNTEFVRVLRNGSWDIHDADIVFWDEAHMQASQSHRKLRIRVADTDAVNVGLTATPVGISDLYDHLVVAGKNSELRKCGAHVPCYVYAPTEPDLKKITTKAQGEFTYNDMKKVMHLHQIFGHVLDHYHILNPDQKPCLVFAPGVAESVWFCEQFNAAGIPAAHIDGEDVVVDGNRQVTSPELRDDVMERFRAGEIKVVTNRFVMREGIDIPELYHLILACPIGSPVSYVQCVGRLLRAHPSLDHVILQDHGGNYWRHDSPNADRDWSFMFEHGLNAKQIADLKMDALKEADEKTPIVCPKCSGARATGAKCPFCGHETVKRTRKVLQADGHLIETDSPAVLPRRREVRPNTEKLWESIYWAMKKSGKTFSQAEAWFVHNHRYWPSRDIPLMPSNRLFMSRKIENVPMDQLK